MPQLDFNTVFINFIFVLCFFILFYFFLSFFFLRRLFSIILFRKYMLTILSENLVYLTKINDENKGMYNNYLLYLIKIRKLFANV